MRKRCQRITRSSCAGPSVKGWFPSPQMVCCPAALEVGKAACSCTGAKMLWTNPGSTPACDLGLTQSSSRPWDGSRKERWTCGQGLTESSSRARFHRGVLTASPCLMARPARRAIFFGRARMAWCPSSCLLGTPMSRPRKMKLRGASGPVLRRP